MKTELSRRVFSVLLCLLLCVSLCPAQVFAENSSTAESETAEEQAAGDASQAEKPEETEEQAAEVEESVEEEAESTPATSGDCGESLTWALNEGVLTISGSGTMTGWEEEPTPWFDSAENITEAVLEDGVEDIGACAFALCGSLQKVTIPASVTVIHDYAFYECSALTAVVLPQNLFGIEDYAFTGCTQLKNVIFTGNAPEMSACVFCDDTVSAYYPQGNDTWTEDTMQTENGPESWSSFRKGDANNDGVVNEDDLALLQSASEGTAEDGSVNMAAADLNGDGAVTAEDSTVLEEQLADGTADMLTIYFNPNGGECETESVSVPNGTAMETLPEASRENYQLDGWFTGAADGSQVTSETVLNANATLYAHWSVLQYTVDWDDCACADITVERTASPMANASCGVLEKGSVVYYSDELQVTYTPVEGFTNYKYGAEYFTVDRNITADDIYATADVLSYTVTWDEGEHTTVTVNRTESPLAGAETGEIENGATVYYNDVLEVTYDVDFGYELTHGDESVTVTGDIGPETIYASATAKEFTYTVIYQSCNGTDLGSADVTNYFGETEYISAPAIEGYTTPDAQEVAWDAESKEISFIYVPIEVTGGPLENGLLWDYADGVAGIKYMSEVEIGERTADSVQVRIHWTQSIFGGFFGYRQLFKIGFADGDEQEVQICSASRWSIDQGSILYDSVTVDTEWITIPVSATQTSLTYKGRTWAESTELSEALGGSFAIPTY